MSAAPLALDREAILAHRHRAQALDRRLPWSPASLRRAAWAGLQDSMPRAALLSIHARVAGTGPAAWEDPLLVQLWGPRFSAYAVAAADRGVFSLGRLPEDARARALALGLADRLEAFLDGRRMPYGEAGRGLGEPPNRLRYAAPTGRVLMRWDGARKPVIWTVPPPDDDPREAALELARRFLHVLGPATAETFAAWAGLPPARGRATLGALRASLVAVRGPIGDGWILAADEDSFRAGPQPGEAGEPGGPARLLPSGDAWFLLQGRDRELLVPEPGHRAELWPSRVWPGAILLGGRVAGTWRRADATLDLRPWRPLSDEQRQAIELEAASLPLPGVPAVVVRWQA